MTLTLETALEAVDKLNELIETLERWKDEGSYGEICLAGSCDPDNWHVGSPNCQCWNDE